MIKLYRATRERRERDKKCKRFVLQIGQSVWHLSRAEVDQLARKGLKALGLTAVIYQVLK